MVTNPLLGTGLVAGFRTSGESERPGFAWFFGRDALWTVLASTSIGDFDTARTALEFLQKFQRDDGKIPHEISQSASLIPWFTDYPVRVGERRRDAALRHRARRLLARERRSSSSSSRSGIRSSRRIGSAPRPTRTATA